VLCVEVAPAKSGELAEARAGVGRERVGDAMLERDALVADQTADLVARPRRDLSHAHVLREGAGGEPLRDVRDDELVEARALEHRREHAVRVEDALR
jgi:hypothetical protein